VSVERRRVRVRGVVQGVGFRPFVYALAGELSLTGEVWNDPGGVVAVVQGEEKDVEAFCERVRDDAPPLAAVEDVAWQGESPVPGSGFVISASQGSGGRTLVPADVATCEACLAEMSDPGDRRYRHPFITCTACGPRFTIVTGLPYDRPMTTMARFEMCADCAREYADPTDRRFHAQPVSCHNCGPVLELENPRADGSGASLRHREEALGRAQALLARGAIVAIKGLGGYHMACDATDEEAVARLRRRKRRGDKPFAVLVPDLVTARLVCEVHDAEADLLTSPRRPIVLLRRRRMSGDGVQAVEAVAPGNPDLGVMLPPTGLHHLLFRPASPGGAVPLQVLVLTSGNLAGEPIATDDDDARTRLGDIADAWLRHDRPIHVPCDDSVTRLVDGAELPIRRSRGYAPLPVPLPFEVPALLAVGGDLKNTFAVAHGRAAWLSAHVGDMDDLATQETFDRAVAHLSELVSVTPQGLVADAHPGYRSAAWAARRSRTGGVPLARVQHHHAHVAAVMAEHSLPAGARVIGVAFDGTGYGDDGAVWGGEGLIAGYDGYERLAHLSYVPLAGGDASVLRTYRMALAHLRSAGVDWTGDLPCVAACPPDERRVLARQLETDLACVPTSSAGRLFDAVSSIAGVCHEAGYEAQAAMELEGLARDVVEVEKQAYPLPLVAHPSDPERLVWDCGTLVRAVVADVLDAVPAAVVGARFHRGLARGVVEYAVTARERTGLDVVALSGGVFANALLTSLVESGLRDARLKAVRHRRVPPNDGGLALGQVVVGARRLAPSMRPSTGSEG